MNRLLIFYFIILTVISQYGHAQMGGDTLERFLGHWYMAQRFAATDSDHDHLLSQRELQFYPHEWAYYLVQDVFLQVDQNQDQHLNMNEILRNNRQEFAFRLAEEKKQIDLLGQQYKYFHTAKAKYLKRHPFLAKKLLANYHWADQHPRIIQQIMNDHTWLREYPEVLRSLSTNFRWLLKYSHFASKLYERKKGQEAIPELSLWRSAHLKLLDQYPRLKRQQVEIDIPFDIPATQQKEHTKAIEKEKKKNNLPTIVVIPTPKISSSDLPSSETAIYSTDTLIILPTKQTPPKQSKEWLSTIDKAQTKLADRLAQIQKGPDPMEMLRDSVEIVVGMQKKSINDLYAKLSEQARTYAVSRQHEMDSLRNIQWNLEAELHKQELQLGSLSRERTALLSQNQKLKHNLTQQNRQIQQLTFEKDSLDYVHKKLSSRMSLLMKEISELNDEYISYIKYNGKIKDSLQYVNTQLLAEIESQNLSISSQQRNLIALRNRLRESDETSASSKRLVRYLMHQQDSISLSVQKQEARIAKMRDSLLNAELVQINTAEKLDNLKDSISHITTQLNTQINQSHKIAAENNSLKRTLAGLQNKQQKAEFLLQKDKKYLDSISAISLKQIQQISELEREVLGLRRQLTGQMNKKKSDTQLSQQLRISEQKLKEVEEERNSLLAELQAYRNSDKSKSQELENRQLKQQRLVLENESMREQLEASQEFVREVMAEKSSLESRILNQELSIAQLKASNDSLQYLASQNSKLDATPFQDSLRNYQTSLVDLEQQIGQHLKEKLMYAQQVETLEEKVTKLEREKNSLTTNKQINELRFRQLEVREQDLKRQDKKNKERELLLNQRETILKQKVKNLEAKEKKYQSLLQKEKELKLLEQRLKQQGKKRE